MREYIKHIYNINKIKIIDGFKQFFEHGVVSIMNTYVTDYKDIYTNMIKNKMYEYTTYKEGVGEEKDKLLIKVYWK